MKCYIASLPEPLIPFELYNDIINARFSIHLMRNTLKKLATVNYMTLELITALLHRVSQKSLLNKVICIYISSVSCLCFLAAFSALHPLTWTFACLEVQLAVASVCIGATFFSHLCYCKLILVFNHFMVLGLF